MFPSLVSAGNLVCGESINNWWSTEILVRRGRVRIYQSNPKQSCVITFMLQFAYVGLPLEKSKVPPLMINY